MLTLQIAAGIVLGGAALIVLVFVWIIAKDRIERRDWWGC